ncbi:MAG: oligosaccharide flippase family protein [Nanoarchaeota archaeon]|nr:oligosaccharide flippase family protein [Nanoarchaeota archaeon]
MSIIQNFKYSLSSKFIIVFLSFFLNLLIVRFLPVSDYAIYVLILSIVLFVSALSHFGFASSIQFFLSENRSNIIKSKKIFGTGVSVISIFIIIYMFVMFLLSPYLSNMYGIPLYFFIFASIFIPIRSIFGIIIASLLAMNKIKALSITNTIYTLSRFSVILCILLGLGSFGALIAELFVHLLSIFIGLFILREIINFSFNEQVFKNLFSFSKKVVLGESFNSFLSPIFEFALGLFSLSSLAFFAAPLKINHFFLIAWEVVYMVFFPIFVSNRHNLKKIRNYIFLIFRFSLIVLGFCFVNILLFSKDILFFVLGDKYLDSSSIFVLQSIAMIINFFFSLLLMLFITSKKPIYSTYSIIFKTVVTIISLMFFIPVFLEFGAAFSFILSVSVGNLLTYYYSKKFFGWKFPFRTFLKCVMSGLLVFVLVKIVLSMFNFGVLSLFVGGFVSLSYFVFLFLLKEFGKSDLIILKKIVFNK